MLKNNSIFTGMILILFFSGLCFSAYSAAFKLPVLPYPANALAPIISEETISYHYGKHHAKYVDNLNNLIKGTVYENMTLEEIVKNSAGATFNNAAQVWNHSFYWNCLAPKAGGNPSGELAAAMDKYFESFQNFKNKFTASAMSVFGSGWTWLVKKPDGRLEIINTSNADTPLKTGDRALMNFDVWEHAYYIDYRNDRQKYADNFWKLVNWKFVSENFGK